MTVVVDEGVAPDDRAVFGVHGNFAPLRKAPAHALEFCEPLDDRLVAHARDRGDRDGREGVAHVVHARKIEFHGQRRMVRTKDGEVHARADGAYVDGAHLCLGREAVPDHGLRDAVANAPDVFVVKAQHRDAVEGQTLEKVDEGGLEIFKIVSVGVHVVFVDVRHDRDHGREIQEGRVRLVGLGDKKLARPEPRVGARAVEAAADHEGGIEPARRQERGDERRGRRLSVGARDRDAAAQTHQFGEHHGARHDGNAEFARGGHFGIVGLHGRGNDDGVRPLDVAFVVSVGDAGAELLQALRHGASRKVGSAHDVTEIEQHLGDAAHAAAADADEMQVFDQKLHSNLLIVTPQGPLQSNPPRLRPPSDGRASGRSWPWRGCRLLSGLREARRALRGCILHF